MLFKTKAMALLMMAGSAVAGEYNARPPTYNTPAGQFIGHREGNIEVFKGIRYARPPVDQLRWQPPIEFPYSDTPVNARSFGSDCAQIPMATESAPSGTNTFSEDCLFLNIWKPHTADTHIPVVVWIHGGGYVNGSASPDVYSGAGFARSGVLFVSMNYRLGRFGFFAHPALRNMPLRGNYGLMDQLAALKWVKRNIGAFGGDINNITIMGESAGGFAVISLLTTHGAKGLFNRAIVESGGGRQNITRDQSYGQAEQAGIEFARRNGIDGQDENALRALRRLPADRLTGRLNMGSMYQEAGSYSGPMIDGRIIVGEPDTLFATGEFNHVPLLIGANNGDIGLPFTATTMQQALAPFGPDNAQDARRLYNPYDLHGPQAVADMISADKMMVESSRFVARTLTTQGVPVYLYRFGYVADALRHRVPAAAHASEIPYAFNTLSQRYGNDVTPGDQAMANAMHTYWVGFIRDGVPHGEGLPAWTPYDPAQDPLMWFSSQGASGIGERQDPRRERLDLIERLPPGQITPKPLD